MILAGTSEAAAQEWALRHGARVCPDQTRALPQLADPASGSPAPWVALGDCYRSKIPDGKDKKLFEEQLAEMLELSRLVRRVSVESASVAPASADSEAAAGASRASAWAAFLVMRFRETKSFTVPDEPWDATLPAVRDEWKRLIAAMTERMARGPVDSSFKDAHRRLSGAVTFGPLFGKAWCEAAVCQRDVEAFFLTVLGRPAGEAMKSIPQQPMATGVGACRTDEGRISAGAQPSLDCSCDKGTITCPRDPSRGPPAASSKKDCGTPKRGLGGAGRAPEGLELPASHDCNAQVCKGGAWVTSLLACAEPTPVKTTPLGRSSAGSLMAELVTLNVKSRVAGKAVVGAAPFVLRLVNVSSAPVSVTTGDLMTWRLTTEESVRPAPKTGLFEPDLTQRLAVGETVTLPPGGFAEFTIPYLANRDRAEPGGFAFTTAGTRKVVLSGRIGVTAGGLSETLEFRSPAMDIEVTP